VIIGDGNTRALAEDVPEREAELEPRGGVLFVIVGLVAGEEDEVGIVMVDVADVFRAQATILVRVAGQGGDDDLVLVHRVLADESLEGGLLTVEKAVFDVLGIVPIRNTEGGRPAEIVDLFAVRLRSRHRLFRFRVGLRGFPRERADRAAR
jgi:hypothetical protein